VNTLIAVVVAYLLGSCTFGFWAGKLRGIDLRTQGSGNTGGTNAVRVLGAKVGIPVIALDIFKGTAAVIIASRLGGTGTEVLAAAAAVLGHAFPVFLRFRGGKAVATGAGAMLGLTPWIAAGVFALWIALGLITRYVSVASMLSAIAFMLAAILTDEPWPVVAFTVFTSAVVFWRHRGNLARLRDGTENRLNLPALRR